MFLLKVKCSGEEIKNRILAVKIFHNLFYRQHGDKVQSAVPVAAKLDADHKV